MTEPSPPIPDDLATCQAQLRAVLEQHAALLQRFHDLECQLDETCATTEELQYRRDEAEAAARTRKRRREKRRAESKARLPAG